VSFSSFFLLENQIYETQFCDREPMNIVNVVNVYLGQLALPLAQSVAETCWGGGPIGGDTKI
jgi:hypothetical protein